MRVVVLGAGVIGVTTAYYLARGGAEVVVLDRQPGPGLEASYANAGELSYGMTSPWAAPGIPMKALKWLFMRHRPLIIWPLLSRSMVSWGTQMLMNCNARAYAVNKGRMVRVSNYSRDCLTELMAEVPLDFDCRERGTLQLFRTEKQLEKSKADQEVLAAYGSPFEVLDRAGCIAAEPGLAAVAEKFVGGLRLTSDRTGDCRMFTLALAEKAAELGVTFRYGVSIQRLATEGDRITRVETGGGPVTGDAYVVALGSFAPLMLRGVGIRLPIYPVKGYSITLPVTDDAMAPQSTIMDETHKVAITRLGDRIRVAGQAVIIGYDERLGCRRDRDRPPCGERPVPQGRRRGAGRGLDRPAPDDPRRHAGDGADALPEPVAQLRPRHAGLDHGLRRRPGRGGPCPGAAAGDFVRRADRRPLRAVGAFSVHRETGYLTD